LSVFQRLSCLFVSFAPIAENFRRVSSGSSIRPADGRRAYDEGERTARREDDAMRAEGTSEAINKPGPKGVNVSTS
jgi:hypothetical protein